MRLALILVCLMFSSRLHAQKTDPALVPPAPDMGAPQPPLPPSQGVAPTQNSQGTATPVPPGQGPGSVPDARTILQGIIEDYRYEPEGKRDPFLPFASPKTISTCGPFEECEISDLQRFDLDQLKLVGILWDVKTPKAMFIDPAGKTHMVNEQDKVGRNNGYVAEIREGELVVIEKFYNLGRFTYQTRVMKLQRE